MARLLFDEETHRYFAGGRRLVSVTQVIQTAGLGVDYSTIPEKVLERARRRGVHVHAACEYVDQQDLDRSSLSDEILPYVEAYWQFCQDTGFEPVATERRLHCDVLGYAGTPDVWGWMYGTERVEIDRKATAVLSVPSVSLQMAGYSPLITKHDPTWREAHRYGLQLRRDGTYRLRRAEEPGADDTFRAALALTRGEATERDHAFVDQWRQRYGTTSQLSGDDLDA